MSIVTAVRKSIAAAAITTGNWFTIGVHTGDGKAAVNNSTF